MKFAQSGKDVRIAENMVWKRPIFAHLGNHITIDDYFYCTTQVYFGDYIHIAPFVSVIGGADAIFAMGDFTTISAGSRIIVRSDAYLGNGLVSVTIPKEYRDDVVGKDIVMHRFSALGTNVVMMPNTWLAEGVVVGANSLVTKPIEEPWTIWVGSPARKIKNRPSEVMLRYAQELGYE